MNLIFLQAPAAHVSKKGQAKDHLRFDGLLPAGGANAGLSSIQAYQSTGKVETVHLPFVLRSGVPIPLGHQGLNSRFDQDRGVLEVHRRPQRADVSLGTEFVFRYC